ncbi:hypothetical protein CERZMDRAFT_83315 [Cercospora zeae-maydis SCOH1-5]|uniref:Uncharacterized protein n=1 Tax=Cercospora zeae-maydis SCOH1-5 TaxID=717836 RepID=A0A6A6FK69_9PEZI|nr:hypothetical protein CERZMDRAFT_83315 [Cercospora zeae-maydis SCOH1-5]
MTWPRLSSIIVTRAAAVTLMIALLAVEPNLILCFALPHPVDVSEIGDKTCFSCRPRLKRVWTLHVLASDCPLRETDRTSRKCPSRKCNTRPPRLCCEDAHDEIHPILPPNSTAKDMSDDTSSFSSHPAKWLCDLANNHPDQGSPSLAG